MFVSMIVRALRKEYVLTTRCDNGRVERRGLGRKKVMSSTEVIALCLRRT